VKTTKTGKVGQRKRSRKQGRRPSHSGFTGPQPEKGAKKKKTPRSKGNLCKQPTGGGPRGDQEGRQKKKKKGNETKNRALGRTRRPSGGWPPH